ncbi:hypothetical protein STASHLEY_01030 [Brevundimonas phage vB_BpoS-StAshley]|nr:hypothetical protein STASHLEY_01030 [Brevundimonas phage vB_BpoS-StAshley]UTC30136.1 hypothetical protein MAINES_00970 [Brevundimonas phage vB_BpoS-MaInes]
MMHKNNMMGMAAAGALASAGNGVAGGWTAERYKAPKTPGTVDPKDIGYCSTPMEKAVFARHQKRRAWDQHTRVDGKLTDEEVQKIVAARLKRERRAERQAKGIRRG